MNDKEPKTCAYCEKEIEFQCIHCGNYVCFDHIGTETACTKCIESVKVYNAPRYDGDWWD